MVGFRVKGRAQKPFLPRMRHDCDLAPGRVCEVSPIYSAVQSLTDFHIGEIGTKEAVGFGESAADFALTADLRWNNLRFDHHGNRGKW